MEKPLLFLIKLAWACRYRLPLLITVGFMALDIRMQLEIHVQMRRIRRRPNFPLRGARQENGSNDPSMNRANDDDSSSWMTLSEDEDDDLSESYSDTINGDMATTSSTSEKVEPINDVIVQNLNNREVFEMNSLQENLLLVNVEN